MSELDDFEKIESEGAAESGYDLSNIYNVTIGGFGLNSGLNTYITSVSVNDLEDDISFYEKLTKDKSWPVSQIIQREVDKIRISNISKNYILGEGRLIKYFPPIIVAILPKDEDGKISRNIQFSNEINDDTRSLIYEKSIYRKNEKLKDLFYKAKNLSLAQDLYLLNISKVFDFNLLCWNKDKYYAIVIDGQHRLEALLKSKKDNSAVGKYKQDVVFLDFNEFIKSEEDKTPVEIVRRIFIDINTNAKKVGIVRQILMDDKDLASLIVQSIVESVNIDGSSKRKQNFFPSELVDWYGKSLKHQLPHLTGILTLYQIFDDYLVKNSLNSINDLRSKTKVKKWVSQMNETFFVDSLLPEGIPKLRVSLEKYLKKVEINNQLKDDIDEEFKESELFTFDYSVLDTAIKRFNQVYLESFVYLFGKFRPYRKAKLIIKNNGGFENGTVLNSALISSPNKIGSSRALKDAIADIRVILTEKLNSNYFLTYSVLFQKVIFHNLIKKISMHNALDFSNEDCLELTKIYTSELNDLIKYCESKDYSLFSKREEVLLDVDEEDLSEYGTIATSFWEGLIYENGNIIYNTQGIRTLSAFVEMLIVYNEARKISKSIEVTLEDVPYLKHRITRILTKQFESDIPKQIEEKSSIIIDKKNKFIYNYFFNDIGN